MGSERACDSATVGPIDGNHLHMSLGMGVWGLREPATVRQGGPNMEIICIYTQAHVFEWGYGPRESLRQCDSRAHIWKSFAYYESWHGGMGSERACDSATVGPIYGNHLHMSLGMGVWGLRQPATVRQGGPNMEIICIYTQAHVFEWGYGPRESLRQCDSRAHIWKSFAYYESWHGGMGSERACDSATVGPIYGNHLHIMSLGMGVWAPREPATVQQVGPYMEIICI